MSNNVAFKEVGEAYAGQSEKGTPYIKLHLREETASDITYGDLTSKVYLFKSKTGPGQYTIMAPVQRKGDQ